MLLLEGAEELSIEPLHSEFVGAQDHAAEENRHDYYSFRGRSFGYGVNCGQTEIEQREGRNKDGPFDCELIFSL